MCGTWHHSSDTRSLSLSLDVRRGCEDITVSANESTLSVRGWFTGVCENTRTMTLTGSSKETPFCLYWDPLLDLLWLDLGGQRHSLCGLPTLRESCCSFSHDRNGKSLGDYGIAKGSVKGDIIQDLLQEFYVFIGSQESCGKETLRVQSEYSKQVIVPDRFSRVFWIIVIPDNLFLCCSGRLL